MYTPQRTAKAIVIVDDDPEDIDLLREAIIEVDNSAACFGYSDPEEAIENMVNNLIVLPTHIFLDINMPKLTGDKCLKKIKQHSAFNDAVVTILSTSMMVEDSEKFKKLGADFTFAKPMSMSDYQKIIEQVFRVTPNY
jgi:CheY-like chemotaxis protein